MTSDVNKATSHKAKAKARELKAKDFQFQHSPRPWPRPRPDTFKARPRPQPSYCYRSTVLDQNKTSDVIYLVQSIAVNNDKNKIPVITSASIF